MKIWHFIRDEWETLDTESKLMLVVIALVMASIFGMILWGF